LLAQLPAPVNFRYFDSVQIQLMDIIGADIGIVVKQSVGDLRPYQKGGGGGAVGTFKASP